MSIAMVPCVINADGRTMSTALKEASIGFSARRK